MSGPARPGSDDHRSEAEPAPEDPAESPATGGSSPPGAGERVVDRADYDPEYDPTAPVYCEVCGAEMYYTASCKLRCPRCGYTRDCSDP